MNVAHSEESKGASNGKKSNLKIDGTKKEVDVNFEGEDLTAHELPSR